MPKNLGNFNKGVLNYKLFLDKLRAGVLNQLVNNTRTNNPKIKDWIATSDSLKATIQLISNFLGKQTNPIFAQKVVRTYHIIQLHSKLWSNHSIIKFTKNFFSTYSHLASKRWLYGLVLLSFCDSPSSPSKKKSLLLQHSIDEKELAEHMNDLDFIHELTAATVVCPNCKDRLMIDKKITNVEYCHCPDASTAYNRKIDGYSYKPFLETPDLLVWRQPMENKPGLFMYKVYGYYNDITPADFFATQLDLEYRKKWDINSVKLNTVEENRENNTSIIYWEMRWPKFFANRDYVFARRHFVDKKTETMVIVNKAISHSKVPEVDGLVRVKEYLSAMQIKAVNGMDEMGTEFCLTYYDAPGLSLPDWLTNWFATVAIPDFLNNVRIAARARHKYEQNQVNFREYSICWPVEVDANSNPKLPESPDTNDTQSEVLSKFFKENFLKQSALGEA